MNKNTKGVITVVAVIAVVFAAFHFGNMNRKGYARLITKLNGTTTSFAELLTFDEGYLKAWAKALVKGKTSFSYQNENYNTQGGKKLTV